jgi:hypothetical protein
MVVNEDGWIVTAAHILKEILAFSDHAAEISKYQSERQELENDSSLKPKHKRTKIAQLPKNDGWIVNQAILWIGQSRIVDLRFDLLADVGVGRLEPFDRSSVQEYPIFKNPAEPMPTGTSLCRLGYPFHDIQATYDPVTQGFELAPGVLPVPRFPNDGIHTREINMASPDGSRSAKFIETSTPGLRGQSGGPIFDARGHVWAIQSQTQSLALGFSPTVKINGKEIVEHQFMHVGWGSHVSEVMRVMNDSNIKYGVSS